ncbi:MAG: glycerophosphodiester phosphodiesterase family protein [Pseudomonadota bacterium]
MIALPASFLTRPIAHRGYHNTDDGRVENSPAAIRAAIKAGYGIEIDVQRSSDDIAMVFHDYDMARLTGQAGPIQLVPSDQLQHTPLVGGRDKVPTLDQVLQIVAGSVPLLIEIKDQDGAMGPDVGALEQAVARSLQQYKGDVAVMSFNPHAIAAFRQYDKTHAVGLVTDPFTQTDWPTIPASRRAELALMHDLDRLGCSFISHNRADLHSPAVARAQASGRNILCWTVRNREQETQARQIADNITFEGYAA